jgi:hypothetical protein
MNLTTRPGPIQGPTNMKRRLEQTILVAIAAVSGSAYFGIDPADAGLALATLNLALALCAEFR